MKTGMFKYSLLAATMAFSGLTMAANPSATLQVKGQVSTGTCTADLTTPNIDLGTTSTDKIPATGGYAVKNNISTMLNVNCTSPLKYQISLTDNRSDSPASAADLGLDSSQYDGALMGLGYTGDNNTKIGGYVVTAYLISSAVNGSNIIKPARLLKSTDSNSSWKPGIDTPINGAYASYMMTPLNNIQGIIGNSGYITVAESGMTEPCATTAAKFEFRSYFYLSSELTSITDQEQIDGSVTFNLDYL